MGNDISYYIALMIYGTNGINGLSIRAILKLIDRKLILPNENVPRRVLVR